MLVYYKDDLVQLLKNEKINFIAYAVTPLHAIGINASICKLRDQGINLFGYILIMRHGTTGNAVYEKDFDVSGTDIKIIYYNDSYYNVDCYKKSGIIKKLCIAKRANGGNRIFLLWTSIPFSFFEVITSAGCEKDVCFVQIDDGGASYANVFRDRLQIKLYEGNNGIVSKIKSYLSTLIGFLIEKIALLFMKNNKNYIDNRIFKLKKGISGNFYKCNTDVSTYYVDAFRRKSIGIKPYIIKNCSKAVLINSQSLEENGITDGKIDLNLYKTVFSIVSDMGMNVVVKPHPRELNPDKYCGLGAIVIPSELCQEEILANCDENPVCIISIFSSTLLNAHGLFGIPAISLAKILIKEEINPIFRRQLLDFVEQYRNVFMFPDSIEELSDIIDNIVINEQNEVRDIE